MKVILIGHPGSQKIRKASEYLTNKYLFNVDITFLNYEGKIEGWAKFAADYLRSLLDEKVIFALDDYLLSEMRNLSELIYAWENVQGDTVLAKLCVCTPEDNESYPVTTQYTLWNREYLISLLEQVTTPWEFEIKGSQLFKESGKKALFVSALKYYTNSSLSKRWQGVRLDGLKDEDIKTIQQWI